MGNEEVLINKIRIVDPNVDPLVLRWLYEWQLQAIYEILCTGKADWGMVRRHIDSISALHVACHI